MLSTYASPTEVCRAALAGVGGIPLNNINENSPQARVARLRYPGVVNSALGRYAWVFATKNEELNYRDADGVPLAHRYDLPAEFLVPRRVYVNGVRTQEYDIKGGFLHYSREDNLTMDHTYRALEQDWWPQFGEAIVTFMESVFTRSLLKDKVAARELWAEGKSMLTEAMTVDYYSQRPKQNDRPGPLVAAHKGYGRAQR